MKKKSLISASIQQNTTAAMFSMYFVHKFDLMPWREVSFNLYGSLQRNSQMTPFCYSHAPSNCIGFYKHVRPTNLLELKNIKHMGRFSKNKYGNYKLG